MTIYPASEDVSPWSPPPFSRRPVVLNAYLENVDPFHNLLFEMVDAHQNVVTLRHDQYRLACRNVCYYQSVAYGYEDGFMVLDLAITKDPVQILEVISTLKHDPRLNGTDYWLIQMFGARDVKVICAEIEWAREP